MTSSLDHGLSNPTSPPSALFLSRSQSILNVFFPNSKKKKTHKPIQPRGFLAIFTQSETPSRLIHSRPVYYAPHKPSTANTTMSFLTEATTRRMAALSRTRLTTLPRASFTTSIYLRKNVVDAGKDALKSVDRAVSNKIVDGIDAGGTLSSYSSSPSPHPFPGMETRLMTSAEANFSSFLQSRPKTRSRTPPHPSSARQRARRQS